VANSSPLFAVRPARPQRTRAFPSNAMAHRARKLAATFFDKLQKPTGPQRPASTWKGARRSPAASKSRVGRLLVYARRIIGSWRAPAEQPPAGSFCLLSGGFLIPPLARLQDD